MAEYEDYDAAQQAPRSQRAKLSGNSAWNNAFCHMSHFNSHLSLLLVGAEYLLFDLSLGFPFEFFLHFHDVAEKRHGFLIAFPF